MLGCGSKRFLMGKFAKPDRGAGDGDFHEIAIAALNFGLNGKYSPDDAV